MTAIQRGTDEEVAALTSAIRNARSLNEIRQAIARVARAQGSRSAGQANGNSSSEQNNGNNSGNGNGNENGNCSSDLASILSQLRRR
jgi:hypothetical protein